MGWCVGMADEADSKSVVGNHVWVQVPPPAVIVPIILRGLEQAQCPTISSCIHNERHWANANVLFYM